MKKIKYLIQFIFIILSIFIETCTSISPKIKQPIRVLILSGKNNHEWQKTTPVLVRIFGDPELFTTRVTEAPETLSFNTLKHFDVVVSNWNSWPDNDMRLDSRWEHDFLQFVNEGGGALFIHAGASSFYGWEEYHHMGIGRWGKETSHGAPTRAMISGFDQDHPITRGMQDFYITDEIWEKCDIDPDAVVLASVSAMDETDGHPVAGPAVFVSQTGKGRSFYTILGHDERAMLNTGFGILVKRAVQWCAHREITVDLPPELTKASNLQGTLTWVETDTSVALCRDGGVIWQYNFKDRFGKPYFHPLCVNRAVLTCLSPPDHPWHLGLWFSWKFINGINYWEYMEDFRSPETGYRSEGITEVRNIRIAKNRDFSADIKLDLSYYPVNGQEVMEEQRSIHVSPVFNDNSYYIDEMYTFHARTDSVLLDRTPIPGEPGGQSWGGYAGLSLRFSQDLVLSEIISPEDTGICQQCDWMYMGYQSLTDQRAGVVIMQNQGYIPGSFAWYVIRDENTPFWYYSPAALYNHNVTLRMGQPLKLSYRTWLLPGAASRADLQRRFDQFAK